MKPKTILKTIIKFSRPRIGRLISAAVLVALIVLVSDFLGPLVLSQIMNLVQAGGVELDRFWPLIGGFALSQLIGFLGWRAVMFLVWEGEAKVKCEAHQKIFENLVDRGLEFHANNFGGSLVNQANKFLQALESFWDTVIFSLTLLLVSLFSAIIILWFQFWQYALVLLFVAFLFAVVTIYFSRNMSKNNVREARKRSEVSGHLSDNMTNVLAVKSYAAEKRELKLAGTKIESWYKLSLEVLRDVNRLMTVSSLINSSVRVLVIVVAVLASYHGLISVGTILLMITYTNTLVMRLQEIRNLIRSYNHIIGDATEMVEILETPIEVRDRSTKKIQVSSGEIEFKDLTFAYEDGRKLFEDFCLKIPAGQKVGLVGHSGSGKSSLTNLLLRFYDLQSGQILIDNQNIAEVSQASLRRAIAYVPQEPMMLHRSVAKNIALGKANASIEEITTAAKQARADEFIQKLTKKYNTIVGERGVKLSGGQKQRVAIARAIIKDAPILILDEATSALDSESEKHIQDAIGDLMVGRTAVVIAHRLSTIANLDRIVVLDNGRIVEDGTHQQLLGRGGVYAKLWRQQSGGFIDEDNCELAPELA